MAIDLLTALAALLAAFQAPIVLTGRVVEVSSGQPVASADIVVRPGPLMTTAGANGGFRIQLPGPGRYTLRVSRIGYDARDTTLALAGDTSVVIQLTARPVEVEPIEARVIRPPYARSGKELFDAEVQPGVVGMSRTEIAEIPSIGEVDVLRALQALPSVIAVNDLSSTLHVMGGGPDQNAFLWDGARVYAPYHMFGVLGAFPNGSIDGIEFYRGAIPARYDDALSSVVDIKQGAPHDGWYGDLDMGTIAVSGTAGGPLPLPGKATWLFGARQTHFDWFLTKLQPGTKFPYAFHDSNGQLSWAPTPAHQIQASFLTTGDRFETTGDLAGEYLELALGSRWSNHVVSGSWQWAGDGPWSSRLGATWSGYDGSLRVGDYRGDYTASDHLAIATVDFQIRGKFGDHSVHVGAAGQGGRVNLIGSESGGYIDGSRDGTVAVVSGFAEAELNYGRVRLVPALRIDNDLPRTQMLIQPRVTARFEPTNNLSVTVGAGRTAQRLHAVRDARTVLPGAPFWVVPAHDQPVTTADVLTGQATWWVGQRWSLDTNGYWRTFHNVPMWFPEGTREVTTLRTDDGRAVGLEFLVRRHGEGITGWLAYGLATVRHTDAESGQDYHPPWDRRHSVDFATFIPLFWGLHGNVRATYGTGTAFWPFGGYQIPVRLTTITGNLNWIPDDALPFWSSDQMRMPQYFRLDLSLRCDFEAFGARFKLSAGMLNVTARANVLYYRPKDQRLDKDSGNPIPLIPQTISETNRIPSLVLHVYF